MCRRWLVRRMQGPSSTSPSCWRRIRCRGIAGRSSYFLRVLVDQGTIKRARSMKEQQ
jgi:hypothetical protein